MCTCSDACIFSHDIENLDFVRLVSTYVCVCAIDFSFSLSVPARLLSYIHNYKYLFFVFVVNNQHTHAETHIYAKANMHSVVFLNFVCLKICFVEQLCNK
jgi:hypothetical protein